MAKTAGSKKNGYLTGTGRWKPVRNGSVFCAPACGGACKLVDYETCVAKAERLAKLLGPAWAPCVWENLGWFYSAVNKKADAEMHGKKHRLGLYVLFCNGGPKQVVTEAGVPKLALKIAIEETAQIINNMSDMLTDLKR